MSLELELLRERLPESLRMRLPSDDGLGSWLEALGPDLADVLRELSPSAMEASLGELVQLGGEALPVLLRLEEHAPDKQQRKLVRRCLHRLRSHGVDVGAPWRGERRSVLAPLGEAAEQGALTPPDPLGRRAIFLLVPVQRGTRIYELLLSDVEGVLHLERVETRRRDARSFLRRLREEHQARLLRVEGPSLRALVLQTLESVSGSTAPDVDPKLLAQLLAGKRTETPGEQVRAKLLDAARCLAQGQAEAILRGRVERGVLPAWPLTGEAVQETVRQLAQLERSQLVLSGVQKRERVQEVLSRAGADPG